jgi:hypothetical protein
MGATGRGSWLASLSAVAAALTTHNRPQDSPQNSPQEPARLAVPVTAARDAGPALAGWS